MRIIAGTSKGMPILPPKGDSTRPLPDRVKAALFSILGGELPPVEAADFYSGTGSFGLEALSRGAAGCRFFERDPEAIRRLRRNLETTRLADRGTVQAGDLLRCRFPPGGAGAGTLGLISVDPPYAHLEEGGLREAVGAMLGKLRASGWAAEDALLIVRTERGLTVPADPAVWALEDRREYGGMTLWFHGPAGGASWWSRLRSEGRGEEDDGPSDIDEGDA